MAKLTCPDCSGDGKETCHNPDHGFIGAMGGDVGRLGCPVCGHRAGGKVPGGRPCDTCYGAGEVEEEIAREFCTGCDYDFDEIYERLTP